MKKVIFTKNAPPPIGPYNQAIVHNGLIYTSGQIAMDLATGQLIQASIEEETHLVMQHLAAILKQVNSTFEEVIKVTIFIQDMNNFSRINTVYASYFDEANAPARETVEVARLPKDAHIEISVIAKTTIA